MENLVDGLYEFDFNPCECEFVDETNWWKIWPAADKREPRRWDLFRIYLQDERGAPIDISRAPEKSISFLNNDNNTLLKEKAEFQTDGRDGILLSKTPREVLDGSKWYVQASVVFPNGDAFNSRLFDIGGRQITEKFQP